MFRARGENARRAACVVNALAAVAARRASREVTTTFGANPASRRVSEDAFVFARGRAAGPRGRGGRGGREEDAILHARPTGLFPRAPRRPPAPPPPLLLSVCVR